MAKQTLRRKKHKKSRRLQRKSLGKSRRLDKNRRLDKSRRLQRTSRIQRGGVPTRLELYTDIMFELLDEVYLKYIHNNQWKDSHLIQYINGFFGNPRNFIKCIKARMVQENSDDLSFGQHITTTTKPTSGIYNNDNKFVVSKFSSEPELQEKWFSFVKSLQETIDNMFSSNIDIAVDVLKYDLTNPIHLREYINKLKGDGLGRNALHKALDRMILRQNTRKPIPSPFLRDIIAQVEHDYPTAAAEINKPKLDTLFTDEKLKIYTSFLSDSATLYIYYPNGKFTIANSFADPSAKDEPGGLKQIHPIRNRGFVYNKKILSTGKYELVLESFPEKYRSDPLILTVSDSNNLPQVETRPASTPRAVARPGARPAATGATDTRPYAPEGWTLSGNVWQGPNGGFAPADTYKQRPEVAADQLPKGAAVAVAAGTEPAQPSIMDLLEKLEELQKKNELIGWNIKMQDGKIIYYKGNKIAESLLSAKLVDTLEDD